MPHDIHLSTFDHLVSVFGRRCVAASPSTVYRRREDVRMRALKKSEESLAAASPLQLCYDGRIIENINRYVFVGQFVNAQLDPCDTVMLVGSIPKTVFVTANASFNTITEQISNGTLQKIYSVMADTIALITEK